MTFWARLQASKLGLGWECDSPEILRLFAFNKLNPVCEDALNCAHLRDNALLSVEHLVVTGP